MPNDQSTTRLPTKFKPASSGQAVPLDGDGHSARSSSTVKVMVYCYCSRGCYFPYRVSWWGGVGQLGALLGGCALRGWWCKRGAVLALKWRATHAAVKAASSDIFG